MCSVISMSYVPVEYKFTTLWLQYMPPASTFRTCGSFILNAEGVWFSEASIWELGLKWRRGKIAVQPRRLADQAFANGLRPLPIQMEPLLVSCELRQSYGDPFDRLLYAQARHGGYRLLTIDRTLSTFGAAVITPK
jgi:PIN domain nuclease of toxin-antitoxin system